MELYDLYVYPVPMLSDDGSVVSLSYSLPYCFSGALPFVRILVQTLRSEEPDMLRSLSRYLIESEHSGRRYTAHKVAQYFPHDATLTLMTDNGVDYRVGCDLSDLVEYALSSRSLDDLTLDSVHWGCIV